MRNRIAGIAVCVFVMLTCLWSASASVNLALKPAGTAVVGGTLDLELWGASDGPGAVMVAGVDAVLAWDPAYLGAVDVVDSVFTGISEFPSELPFPINFSLSDGNAFYSAVLAIGQALVEVNEAVLLARFSFAVQGLTGPTAVGIVPYFDGLGQVPELATTAVWDREGLSIVGAMGSAQIDILAVAEPASFLLPFITATLAVVGMRRSPRKQ